jgi:hypothetical protein
MPSFTIKVELHGAANDSIAYEALHEAMERRHFSRSITLSEILQGLSPAGYTRSSDLLNGPQILKEAQAAATDVWEDFSVTVTQADKPWLEWTLKKIK